MKLITAAKGKQKIYMLRSVQGTIEDISKALLQIALKKGFVYGLAEDMGLETDSITLNPLI